MWRVRGDGVSMERLDGETIVINFDSGEYFSFRGSSADILWLVEAEVSEQSWGKLLESEFPDLHWNLERQQEVHTFLQDLASAGLIETTDAPSINSVDGLPNDYPRTSWSAPSVQAHDDLVDLLVIDPIHDASDGGWPNTRTP